MEILISLMVAVFIYLSFYILISSFGPGQARSRIKKYFTEYNVDDVQEQFIREKNKEESKRKKDRFKLASKEFSNLIASSGIRLKANEFLYFWAGLTLIPMMLVLLFSGNIITGAALSIIGISIPPSIVSNARKKREELFTKQLGDATVIMGNSIKGGFTFCSLWKILQRKCSRQYLLNFQRFLEKYILASSRKMPSVTWWKGQKIKIWSF